ncbi:unnamed protein product, partial [Prorocentrum cordatum]
SWNSRISITPQTRCMPWSTPTPQATPQAFGGRSPLEWMQLPAAPWTELAGE